MMECPISKVNDQKVDIMWLELLEDDDCLDEEEKEELKNLRDE